MGYEIERKFLLKADPPLQGRTGRRIIQGYISRDPERNVRIRIRDKQAFITIKGSGSGKQRRRYEWEKEIPLEEGRQLMKLCHAGLIDKTRYNIPCGEHIIELDCFHGENEGLVLAEIELKSENEAFERPSWLGREVTGQIRYYNNQLSQHPYLNWDDRH